MKYDEDFAMSLVGRRVKFRKPHGDNMEEHLIERTTLTNKDILLGLDDGDEVPFSGIHLILATFSKDDVKSETDSVS